MARTVQRLKSGPEASESAILPDAEPDVATLVATAPNLREDGQGSGEQSTGFVDNSVSKPGIEVRILRANSNLALACTKQATIYP